MLMLSCNFWGLVIYLLDKRSAGNAPASERPSQNLVTLMLQFKCKKKAVKIHIGRSDGILHNIYLILCGNVVQVSQRASAASVSRHSERTF